MTVEQLAAQMADAFGYWQDHPGYPAEVWRTEVANGDTRAGYWIWVAQMVGPGED